MSSTTQDYGRWVIPTASGLDSLEYIETPVSFSLRPDDTLVRLHAASLNPRDVAVVKGVGKVVAGANIKPGLVPGSDGAGVIVEVGSAVTAFQPGDRVVTHIALGISDDAFPTLTDLEAGLGHETDGTLRRLGVFHQTALVHMPSHLSFEEAATVTCSGLTAWNALMAAPGRPVRSGDYVLVQGTGGVSIAALQIAVAAGATVIATTSSDDKAVRLRALGAAHVINYRTTLEWGKAARQHTPSGRGVDHVVDIGGNSTLPQSIAATRIDGIVSLAGASGGFDAKPTDIFEVLWNGIIIRGVLVGGRQMLRDMMEWMEVHRLKPALDDVAFELRDVKKAYERLDGKKHFSKVVIKIN
ncbi:hypothetical protein F5Y10DRAFT_200315 [Nemania abortiva]|nr:hypothetical protein F5Y10DRAFT_200315 [Nemania abortiva]